MKRVDDPASRQHQRPFDKRQIPGVNSISPAAEGRIIVALCVVESTRSGLVEYRTSDMWLGNRKGFALT